jgi:hypothetical protein
MGAGALHGEASAYPLGINLPTSDRMQFWDIGIAFTHRFDTPVQGHGKDVYGLDGYAYSGLGVDFGIKPIKGLNVILYRTADNKTFTMALQQQVMNFDHVRMALRAERFDEVVPRLVTPRGTLGISGTTFLAPTEFFIGEAVTFSLVPTLISRTTSQEKSVFNVGAGLRVEFSDKFSFISEYYPRPSKLAKTFEKGWAAGVSYKTFKHRFTLVGTNASGSTSNQILSGDYAGGPRPNGKWGIGFNVVRTF